MFCLFWDSLASKNPALGRKSVGGFFCLRLQPPDLCSLRQKAAEYYSWPFLICFCSCSSMRFKLISYAHYKGWILSWCEQAQLCFDSCTGCQMKMCLHSPGTPGPCVTLHTALQTEGCTNMSLISLPRIALIDCQYNGFCRSSQLYNGTQRSRKSPRCQQKTMMRLLSPRKRIKHISCSMWKVLLTSF